MLYVSQGKFSRGSHTSHSYFHQKFNLSLIASITMANYMAKTYNLFVDYLALSTIPT